MNVEREIDELYAGPPESFVKGRDGLAKRLKSDGRDQEAAAVKALRRPTVAAWALNRLAHDGKDPFGSLEALARDLRKAQRGALSGLRGTALREAVKRRRSVVDAIADAAVEGLESEGKGGEAQREAITRTLEAAAADPDALDALRAGRLEKELQRPTGFGDLAGLTGLAAVPDSEDDDGDESAAESASTGRSARAGAKRKSKKAAARPSPEEARLRRLRTQRDQAADDARTAAQAAVRAGERAVRSSSEAEAAATEIERLERDLRAARRRHRDAIDVASGAAASAKKAEADAERARKKVEDLQARIEKLLAD